MKPISQNMYLIVWTPIHRYTSRIRPIFSNQLWETPNNDLCACPRWEFQQHASRTLAALSIDQSLSISHCQCTLNSHITLMINHFCPKKSCYKIAFILFCAPAGCSSDRIQVAHKDTHILWPADLSLTTIDPLSPTTPKNRNLWFLFSS